MKKLFTLVLALGCLSSVFAQYNNGDYKGSRPDRNDDRGKDYAYNNDRRYNESYSMTMREKDFKIQKITREYDYKINSVMANRYLRPRERKWQVENLQHQKYNEIRDVELFFKDSRNRYNGNRPGRW